MPLHIRWALSNSGIRVSSQQTLQSNRSHTDQHYHRRSVHYQGFEMTYQAVPAESVTTEHCQEGPGRHWTMADECQALQEQGRTLYDDC